MRFIYCAQSSFQCFGWLTAIAVWLPLKSESAGFDDLHHQAKLSWDDDLLLHLGSEVRCLLDPLLLGLQYLLRFWLLSSPLFLSFVYIPSFVDYTLVVFVNSNCCYFSLFSVPVSRETCFHSFHIPSQFFLSLRVGVDSRQQTENSLQQIISTKNVDI